MQTHRKEFKEVKEAEQSIAEAYSAVAKRISQVIREDNGGEGTNITITKEWTEFIQQCARAYLRSPKLQLVLRTMVETKINEVVESVVGEELDALASEIVEKSKAGLQERFEAQVDAAIQAEIKKAIDKVKAGLFR